MNELRRKHLPRDDKKLFEHALSQTGPLFTKDMNKVEPVKLEVYPNVHFPPSLMFTMIIYAWGNTEGEIDVVTFLQRNINSRNVYAPGFSVWGITGQLQLCGNLASEPSTEFCFPANVSFCFCSR